MQNKPISLPSKDKLNSYFRYKDGQLIWRKLPQEMFKTPALRDKWHKLHLGKNAAMNSTWRGKTYKVVRIPGIRHLFKVHRIIYKMHTGLEPDMIDHADNNSTNNRIENLRPTTNSLNQANSKKQANTKHKYKGFSYCRSGRRYSVTIYVNKQPIYLGSFLKQEEAKAAYDQAAEQYFGEFARNEPALTARTQ